MHALADAERSTAPRTADDPARDIRLQAAAAVLAHCLALVDAAGPACVAVKPQLAYFERLGFAGLLALEATVAHARAQGLLVIADAKRGDIASTATAYAQAWLGDVPTPFGRSPGLHADAMTLNPLLGADALEPFAATAARAGRGPVRARAHVEPRRRGPLRPRARRRRPAVGAARAARGRGRHARARERARRDLRRDGRDASRSTSRACAS